jgi:hypothetical protein
MAKCTYDEDDELPKDLVEIAVLKHLLAKMTDKARKSSAESPDTRRLLEACKLLLEYHTPKSHGQRRESDASRFPRLSEESLDYLAAVCIEFAPADTWHKALKLFRELFRYSEPSEEPELAIKALAQLLHHTPTHDNFQQASSLVHCQLSSVKDKMAMCDKIITACEEVQDRNR